MEKYLTPIRRKNNLGNIFVTQSGLDAERAGYGALLNEACPMNIFLSNPKIQTTTYRELFGLNEKQAERIVRQRPRQDVSISTPQYFFVATAQPVLDKLGLFALVMGALTWIYSYLTGNHIFSGEHFWRVLIRYLIAYNLLRYYNSPMPLVGYSFHQLFTEEARWMAAQIDISVLDRFLSEIQQIWGTMEKPHVWDIPATVIYVWISLDMAMIECGIFAITVFSFWAIGVGLILGPFFIIAYLFRGTSHFFWAWVNYMIKYSLYRVVASALVAVFTNVILNFIDNTVHGDYSLGHWWAIAISWTVVVVAGLFACLKVSQLVNDLTTGGAYAGTGGLPIPVLRRFL